MLDLARADSGQTEEVFATVDISRLIADGILPFEPVYFEHGLSLFSEIEEEIRVWGSEERLRQLLEILLDNACKLFRGKWKSLGKA